MLFVVDLREFYFDNFIVCSLHGAADEGGFDWQLAVAAIDQHAELYPARASVIEQCVQCSANRAPRIEHVITQHYVQPIDVKAKLSGIDDRLQSRGGQIIAIELDIEHTQSHRFALDLLDMLCQPLREGNAPPLDANKREPLRPVVFLYNLVRKPHERPLDF